MKFEQNEIIKLTTFENKTVYAAVVKGYRENKHNMYLVKILKQPLHEIATLQTSTSLFKQFCHENDEILYIPMNYDSANMAITICENMMVHVTHNEIVDLLKHFNQTSFGNETANKSPRETRREKMIISEALERLYHQPLAINFE